MFPKGLLGRGFFGVVEFAIAVPVELAPQRRGRFMIAVEHLARRHGTVSNG
jgi:hypothetical protein